MEIILASMFFWLFCTFFLRSFIEKYKIIIAGVVLLLFILMTYLFKNSPVATFFFNFVGGIAIGEWVYQKVKPKPKKVKPNGSHQTQQAANDPVKTQERE